MLFIFFFHFVLGRNPVLLVPGLGGSQIFVKATAAEDWGLLWLDIVQSAYCAEVLGITLDPVNCELYISRLQTTFDNNTGEFKSSPLFPFIKAGEWGSVKGIDVLGLGLLPQADYYAGTINALKNAGYTDQVDLFGAPFDFRLESYASVQNPGGLFSQLKTLIEDIYDNNTNKPIVLVTHSEGSTIGRHFLANGVNQAWKDKYIKTWISAAGAFGGAPMAFHHLTSDRKWVVPTLNGEKTHRVMENFAGVYWMLPNKRIFGDDYLLATIEADSNRKIPVENITEMFELTYGGELLSPAQFTLDLITSEFNPPNVPMHVYYGSGVPTVDNVVYKGTTVTWWKEMDETKVIVNNVSGDGTVTLNSLLAPQLWTASKGGSNGGKEIKFVEVPNAEHVELLDNEIFTKAVVNIATDGEYTGDDDDDDDDDGDDDNARKIFIPTLTMAVLFVLFFLL